MINLLILALSYIWLLFIILFDRLILLLLIIKNISLELLALKYKTFNQTSGDKL